MKGISVFILVAMLVAAAVLPGSAEYWFNGPDYTGAGMVPPWGFVFQAGGVWDGTFDFAPMIPDGTGLMIAGDDGKCWAGPSYDAIAVTSYKGLNGNDGKQGFMTFCAPYTGSYAFTFEVNIATNDPNGNSLGWIRKSGDATPIWSENLVEGTRLTRTVTVSLNKGETLYFGQDIIVGFDLDQSSTIIWRTMVQYTTRVNLAVSNGAVVSASSYLVTARKYTKAVDGNLNSMWEAIYENWMTYDYPHAWLKVTWPTPQTLNRVDVLLLAYPDFQPKEMVVDVYDAGTGVWTEIARFLNTKFGCHYTALLPTPVVASALRYRCEYAPQWDTMINTHGHCLELGIYNVDDTSKWATVTGTVTNSIGRPIKGAFVFFDVGNGKYENLPSGADGSYSVTVDTELAPENIGGHQVAAYASGQSYVTGGPADGVVRTPVTPTPGTVQTANITLPGPEEAYTTLGPEESRTYNLLTQTCNYADGIPYPYFTTQQATVDGVDCIYIPQWGAWFRTPHAYAYGYCDKMYVTIDYYDDAETGWIYVVDMPNPSTYVKASGLWMVESDSKIRREGSNTWRSQTLVVPNAFYVDTWFETKAPSYPAGIFSVYGNKSYLSRVAVAFDPGLWNKPDPSVTFGTAGTVGGHVATRSDDRGLHPRLGIACVGGSSDLGTIIEDVGATGIPGYQTTGTNRQGIWFDVDDKYLYSSAVGKLYATVKYFDQGTDQLAICMIDSADGITTKAQFLTKTNTNTWKTATLLFEDVCVNDVYDTAALRDYGAGDMYISDCADGDDIIGSVSVSAGSGPVNYTSVSTIAEAKAQGGNAKVEFASAKTVTGNFGGFFYVEEEDRTSGIRINGSTSAVVGQRVIVRGTLTKAASGEDVIVADDVSEPVAGVAISPLGVVNRALDGVGLSAVGLVIQTFGTVLSGTGTGEFEITDGSNVQVKVSAQGYSAPAAGTFVVVKGVCGLESAGVPVIRVVDPASDIQ